MTRILALGALAVLVAFAAHADVKSTIKTADQYQCVRVGDGVAITASARQDMVAAACAVAVERSQKPHDLVQPTLHFSYLAPVAPTPVPVPVPPPVTTPSPPPTPPPQAKYVNLTPTCSDQGSVGKPSCQVPPTRFDFPVATSIVKSDGIWLVFGDLPAGANVLVCSVEQTPGAIADPYRDLCKLDTYITKSAVPLSPAGPAAPPVVPPAPATGSAKLTWIAPTTNTDNSTLTDLAGYQVLYGTHSPPAIAIEVGDVTAYEVANLPPGDWVFAVRARNASGTFSALSAIARKTIP